MPEYDEDDDLFDEDEEEDSSDDGYLYDYDYKPRPVFVNDNGVQMDRPETKSTMYLGIELEVKSQHGDRREDVSSLSAWSDKIYMKKDGSLDNDIGFEIVTYPLSPKYTYTFLPKLSERLKVLCIKGHSAGAGYGMHVHVSRASLSRLHQAKLMVFMSDENRELLITVAQRESEQWCEIKEKGISPVCELFSDDDKYQALNVVNRRTLEFRIFRSNTEARRLLKNIDFVLAAIEFTRCCGIKELTTECFLKWLKVHRKEYMYLYKFLSEKEEGTEYAGRYADVLNYRRAKRATNAEKAS